MSLTNAILSGVVGYLIVIVLFCLMGIMGSDLGVPTCVTAIGGFGKKRSKVHHQYTDLYLYDRLVRCADQRLRRCVF